MGTCLAILQLSLSKCMTLSLPRMAMYTRDTRICSVVTRLGYGKW